MSSKTKIVVLHMKEIIYTAIFALLGIILLLLLIFMFLPKTKETAAQTTNYNPGIYTAPVALSNTDLSVEVTVNETGITAIRFSSLDEETQAKYPLLQPAIEDLAKQIVDSQKLTDLQFSEDSPYTSQVLLNAIDEALKQSIPK